MTGLRCASLIFVGLLWAAAAARAASEKEVIDLYRQAAGAMQPARVALERLAGEGDGLAAHFLGRLHLDGKGVRQDETVAVQWFRKSAVLGRADSAHNLGVIYERSRGTLRDPQEARRWYAIAAEQGYARSQSNLGFLLLEGIGGPPDVDRARRWIEQAAAQSDPRGRYLLGMLTLQGRAGIAKDAAEALRLLGLAAEGNEREAQYRIALLHGSGQGVEQSDRLALEWLRKSAAQRLPEAELLLAAVYSRGLYGVVRDPKVAAGWLRRSALQGNVEAQYGLGLAYAEGNGVRKDATEAYGWMLHAARNGHARAIEFVNRVQSRLPKPEAAAPRAADEGREEKRE
jgi:hypothetical protein